MEIKIRGAEATETQPLLQWDSIWDNVNNWAEWQIAGPTETENQGGLSALQALNTAVVQLLFTWARAESYELDAFTNDPQGWWGDSVDLEDDEVPLGSKLYLLLRSPLTDAVGAQAVVYATTALQPLLTQGACASLNVTYQIDFNLRALFLTVSLYAQNGSLIYSQKFSRVWQQETQGWAAAATP